MIDERDSGEGGREGGRERRKEGWMEEERERERERERKLTELAGSLARVASLGPGRVGADRPAIWRTSACQRGCAELMSSRPLIKICGM